MFPINFQAGGSEESGSKMIPYPRQPTLPQPSLEQLQRRQTLIGPNQLVDALRTDAERALPRTKAGAAYKKYVSIKKAVEDNENRKLASVVEVLAQWEMIAKGAAMADIICKNVNLGGLRQTSRARSFWLKLFWFTVTLFFTGIMIYELIKCVIAYQESPIATKYSLLTPDAMEFPEIYLCYGSSFNRTYVTSHKDQMAIATVYRSRSAVTIGGKNRRKRDLNQIFNHDPHDIKIVNDEEITKMLLETSDSPLADSEESMTQSEVRDQQDAESDSSWTSDYDLIQNFNFGQTPQQGRVKRDAVVDFKNVSTFSNATVDMSMIYRQGNFSTNASAAETAARMKADAAAEAKRIEAMMNSENISDIVYDYFHEAAYRVEETFLECSFKSYKAEMLDCKEILIPIMDANYGMCYLVNLPDDLKQVVAGKGLRLVLNSHISLYPRANEGAPKYAGLLVSVNRDYDPFNWLKSLAAPGHLTKIDLSGSYVELMNLESGSLIQPCVNEEQGRAILRIFKDSYSRTLCQMDCLYQAHRNACQCILPIDKSQVKEDILNDTVFCGPKQFSGCLASSAATTDKVVDQCREQCHTPCVSYRYEMRSSNAKLHGPAYKRWNIPATELIELWVAYNRKEIVKLKQKPSSTFSDMVSNLGGQANLWLGASMVTLMQIVIMAFAWTSWTVSKNIHDCIRGKKSFDYARR